MLEREFGYKPPIPESLQSEYETALSKVVRWKTGDWEDSNRETDMDHIAGMFIVLEDLNGHCPTLYSNIDLEVVKHMMYVHDAGEIAVDDLAYDIDNYDVLRPEHKRKEYILARWMIKTHVEDRQIRSKALRLYERYIAQRNDDKEALLAEFIDKLQGARFGFKNKFNARATGMKAVDRKIRFDRTVQKFLVLPLKPLLKCVSPETQDSLKTFLKGELESFSTFGYQKEATPHIENLDAILQ